jgi:hypothetical protein
MVRFPRNFRDTLLSAASTRTLLIAAVVVALLFVALVVAYTAFDLGVALPQRRS